MAASLISIPAQTIYFASFTVAGVAFRFSAQRFRAASAIFFFVFADIVFLDIGSTAT